MSQLGLVIDSLEFAQRNGALSGRLRLNALPRLAEVLFDTNGELAYEVSGETAGERAFLVLMLAGLLRLTCQRCLGAMEFALNVRSRVMLVEPGSPWPDDDQVGGLVDEACDAIEALHELDLVPLMEEEILLGLPIAPRHERCEPPATVAASAGATPFAQLARLKRN